MAGLMSKLWDFVAWEKSPTLQRKYQPMFLSLKCDFKKIVVMAVLDSESKWRLFEWLETEDEFGFVSHKCPNCEEKEKTQKFGKQMKNKDELSEEKNGEELQKAPMEHLKTENSGSDEYASEDDTQESESEYSDIDDDGSEVSDSDDSDSEDEDCDRVEEDSKTLKTNLELKIKADDPTTFVKEDATKKVATYTQEGYVSSEEEDASSRVEYELDEDSDDSNIDEDFVYQIRLRSKTPNFESKKKIEVEKPEDVKKPQQWDLDYSKIFFESIEVHKGSCIQESDSDEDSHSSTGETQKDHMPMVSNKEEEINSDIDSDTSDINMDFCFGIGAQRPTEQTKELFDEPSETFYANGRKGDDVDRQVKKYKQLLAKQKKDEEEYAKKITEYFEEKERSEENVAIAELSEEIVQEDVQKTAIMSKAATPEQVVSQKSVSEGIQQQTIKESGVVKDLGFSSNAIQKHREFLEAYQLENQKRAQQLQALLEILRTD